MAFNIGNFFKDVVKTPVKAVQATIKDPFSAIMTGGISSVMAGIQGTDTGKGLMQKAGILPEEQSLPDFAQLDARNEVRDPRRRRNASAKLTLTPTSEQPSLLG